MRFRVHEVLDPNTTPARVGTAPEYYGESAGIEIKDFDAFIAEFKRRKEAAPTQVTGVGFHLKADGTVVLQSGTHDNKLLIFDWTQEPGERVVFLLSRLGSQQLDRILGVGRGDQELVELMELWAGEGDRRYNDVSTDTFSDYCGLK